MAGGITFALNEPLGGGYSAIAAETPWQFPVAIAGRPYLVDLREYRRTTIEALRTASDQGIEVGENSLNPRGLWRRSQSDWRFGAGQRIYDLGNERTRFWKSRGVDPWTEGKLSLLPDTTRDRASANTGLLLLEAGDYLYFADGAVLRWWNGTTWASETLAAAITSLTTDGTNIYAAIGTAIRKAALGGATAAFGSYAADMVGYANGRLFAADGAQLVEVAANGTTTVVTTHKNAGFAWAGVMAAPNAAYVWGRAGDVGEVYAVDVDDTGALTAPAVATPLPPGESIRTLAYAGGVFVLGTSLGLRLGIHGDGNTIRYGTAIDAPGTVRCVAIEGRYVWFGWTNFATGTSGVGRADLGALVDESEGALVPAYASDLMATVGGTTAAVARYGGKTWFAIDGDGLWTETSQRVASGWLETGEIYWGTLEAKLVASVDVRHEPLAGSVTPTVIREDGTETTLGSSTVVNSLGPTSPLEARITGVEWVRLRITLDRSSTDATKGPVLRRWTARVLPTPVRIDEFIVPLVLRSKVDSLPVTGQPTARAFALLEEFQFLKGIESAGRPVRYTEGTTSYTVYIDAVQVNPEKWASSREFYEGIVIVRLVTLEPTS